MSPFHFPTYLGRSKGLCSQRIKDLARQQQSCLLHCNEADLWPKKSNLTGLIWLLSCWVNQSSIKRGGVNGLLRDTWLSVFNFRERWKYEIKTRELWLVCLSWYVNFKIFYPIFVICQMSDVWCLMSDVRCLMSDVRRLMSDIRRLIVMSDIWCQMSDVWCQMSDIRRLMSDIWCLISNIGALPWDKVWISYIWSLKVLCLPDTDHVSSGCLGWIVKIHALF